MAWRVGSDESRLMSAYKNNLDKLGHFGIYRKFGESRELFAQRIADMAPHLSELSWRVLQFKLGKSRALTPDELRTLHKNISREIKSIPKNRMWILRVLNPLSWWWTK